MSPTPLERSRLTNFKVQSIHTLYFCSQTRMPNPGLHIFTNSVRRRLHGSRVDCCGRDLLAWSLASFIRGLTLAAVYLVRHGTMADKPHKIPWVLACSSCSRDMPQSFWLGSVPS